MLPRRKSYLNLNLAAWRNLAIDSKLNGYEFLFRKHILGSLFSICGRLQSSLIGNEISKVQSRPHIVIAGHWRSGTTFLHNLMCLDPQFAFASTAHCMNPHIALLDKNTTNTKTSVRPMDSVIVSAHSPQEDEFALLTLGARSPYEGLICPDKLDIALSSADPENLDPKERIIWEKTFLSFLSCVSQIGRDRPVILKSPTHSYRIKSLSALLPNSKFISIKRNPLEVFESTFQMWRSLFDLYSLGDPIPDNTLRELILQNRIVMERKLTTGLNSLKEGRAVSIEYEKLISEPLKQLQYIYDALELASDALKSDHVNQAVLASQTYQATNKLPPASWRDRVLEAWSEFE